MKMKIHINRNVSGVKALRDNLDGKLEGLIAP